MAIRYGDRSRVSTSVGRWLNQQPNAIPYSAPLVANASNVTITASVSAHTYGAWTELVASLTQDTQMLGVYVNLGRINGTNTASIISFGFGSSGSETEFAAFACGSIGDGSVASANGIFVQLPISLPSGTRIAARLQSIITTPKTCIIQGVVSFAAQPYDFVGANKTLDSLGLNLAGSTGTDIAASGVYSEIVASTSQAYRGLVLIPSMAIAASGAIQPIMTVAVGSAGSEVDLGSITFNTSAGESLSSQPSFFIPAFVPQGSRIAVKQNNAATYLDATVIGVPF